MPHVNMMLLPLLLRFHVAVVPVQAIQQAQLVAWQLQLAQGSSSTGLNASFHEQCAWLMDKV
jgi:hypothetical protein